MLHYKTWFIYIILPSGLQSCSDDEEIHDDDDYSDEDDDGDNEEKEGHSHQ